MTTTAAVRSARVLLLILALSLPTLTLVPLGGLFLWEHGYLLPWALLALLSALTVYYLQWRWLGTASNAALNVNAESEAPEAWTSREKAAWDDVKYIAATVEPASLDGSEAAFELAIKIIRIVASRIHPESKDPEWKFTLPEALAISERVSRRLGRFVIETVPFGDRLTVGQFMALYRARRFLDLADKAYDIWRVMRLVNPATALTNEARERLTRAVYNWGKDHITRRVAEAYVEEVGRAAIDLYGGRLRLAAPDPSAKADHPAASTAERPRGALRQAGSAIGTIFRHVRTKKS